MIWRLVVQDTPRQKLTWLAGRSQFLIGDYILKCLFFHCHPRFPGCRSFGISRHWICLFCSLGGVPKIPKDLKQSRTLITGWGYFRSSCFVFLFTGFCCTSDGVIIEVPGITIQTESAEFTLHLFGWSNWILGNIPEEPSHFGEVVLFLAAQML